MNRAVINRDSLVVGGQEYRSGAFGTLLDVLGVASLDINAAPPEPDGEGSRNFTVTGTMELFSQPVTVELYLEFVRDGAFEFELATSIPSLTLGVLHERKILPDSPFVQPLLSTEFPDVQLVYDSEEASLYLASLESARDAGPFEKLALKRLGFEFVRGYVQRTVLLDVYAEIDIGSTPIEVKIEIPLGGSLSPRCWVLTSRSEIPFGNGLEDIGRFLGETVGLSPADIFPEELHSTPTFFLDDLRILLGPGDAGGPASLRLQFLTFRLKSVRELKLSGSLVISQVGLRVNVTPATPRPELTLTLFGLVKVKDGTHLNIQVMLPANLREDPWGLFISGGMALEELTDLQHLPVGHTVEDLKLHPGFLKLRSLALKKLEVDFNPLQKTIPSVAFDLTVNAECELIHGFKLANPRLEFTAQNPFNQPGIEQQKSLTGTLWGTIDVGGVQFGIEAAKRSDGWSFSGSTAPGAIPIGDMVAALLSHYRIAVPQLVEHHLALESLSMRFDTAAAGTPAASTTVIFNAEGSFTLSKESPRKVYLAFDTTIRDEPGTGRYHREFGGELRIGSAAFQARYGAEPSTAFFVGAYADARNEGLRLSALLEEVSPSLASAIPDGLGVTLKDALFAFSETVPGAEKFLFGIDVGLQLDFRSLPLVGKALSVSSTGKLGLENLQVLVASREFTSTEVQNLNGLLGTMSPPVHLLPEVTRSPVGSTDLPASPPSVVLNRGFNLAATLNLGGSVRPLAFPTSNAPGPLSPGAQPIPGAAATDSAFWLDVQKSVGPLYFERVGVEYRNQKLWVLLSSSLTAGGLTLSLNGLSLGVGLKAPHELEPALRGLGVDYRNEAVEIGGSFLKVPSKDPKASAEYSGAAVLKARGFTLNAWGSYTTVKDPAQPGQEDASFFIYALLDYPIGGPSFFFITGLAAGFGYNRAVVVPAVERLSQFPLLQVAENRPKTLSAGLTGLSRAAESAPGQHFLAAGITFTSFQLIQSSVILMAGFGKRFELHLVGLSTMKIPADLPGGEESGKVSPIAEVELALKGSFIPDEGLLELRAQLTPTSYLFNSACHLTGGFAFLCGFEPKAGVKSPVPEGDFVLTLGGYHPSYRVPAHYPSVPRLGFSWQVIPETLSLRGDAYFALTPSAVMAGGHLQAEWRSGPVFAWFKAGIDFLIAWKPYHYEAHAYIDIGVELTFEFFGTQRLSLDVGADLAIWGPEFAGKATVHLWIISFTIHFGNDAASKPATIEWDEFRKSFLPGEHEVCSIAVADGLVRKRERLSNDLGVINGKHFCLVTDSRIPSTVAMHNGKEPGIDAGDAKTEFGVFPVGIPALEPSGKASVSSTHTITINRTSGPAPGPVSDRLDFRPVTKRVPAALWGDPPKPAPGEPQSAKPSLNGPQFVEKALTGVTIRAKPPPPRDQTPELDRSQLLVNSDSAPRSCQWGVFTDKAGEAIGDFHEDLGTTAMGLRNALLESLGMKPAELHLDDSLACDYLRRGKAA